MEPETKRQMQVDGGYEHCPTCNGLVRVIDRYDWGRRLATHLWDGSRCPLTEIVDALTREDHLAVMRFKKALEQDIVETRRSSIDPENPQSGVVATNHLLYTVRGDGPTLLRVIDFADERISALLAEVRELKSRSSAPGGQ